MRELTTTAFVYLLLMVSMNAQTSATKVSQQESSDPKAKVILDRIRKQYDAYTAIEATFTLTIEVPEQARQTQKGKIIQQGKKYYLELPDQLIYCDGATVWYYLKNNNEVQINNADDDNQEAILTPKDLLKFYQRNDYLYALAGEATENSKVVQYIEFKPTNRNNEYTKLRLTVDKISGAINSIKAFSRDGSRYTLTMNTLTPNKTYASSYFTFNKAKYPGIHVEDLRIE